MWVENAVSGNRSEGRRRAPRNRVAAVVAGSARASWERRGNGVAAGSGRLQRGTRGAEGNFGSNGRTGRSWAQEPLKARRGLLWGPGGHLGLCSVPRGASRELTGLLGRPGSRNTGPDWAFLRKRPGRHVPEASDGARPPMQFEEVWGHLRHGEDGAHRRFRTDKEALASLAPWPHAAGGALISAPRLSSQLAVFLTPPDASGTGRSGGRMGYPVTLICAQLQSPLANWRLSR